MGQSRFSIKGMYLQWGYNTEWFTRSDIHFKGSVNGVPHDFTAYNVRGVDQNDFDAILKKPIEVSVPQYNYRIGFYLNKEKTKAIEFNSRSYQIHCKRWSTPACERNYWRSTHRSGHGCCP